MNYDISRKTITDISSIYKHIFPHIDNMDLDALKKEIALVTYNLAKNNAIHTTLLKNITEKIINICSLPTREKLKFHLTNFCMWLDNLQPTETGYTLKTSPSKNQDSDVARQPTEILDDLHFFYSFNFFLMTKGKATFNVYAGPNHVETDYNIARHIAALFPSHTYINIDTPTIKGRIYWLDAKTNRISIKAAGLKNAGNIYDILEVFPHLR